MKKKDEMTKQERISEEIKRLSKIYNKLDTKSKAMILGLIQRAAFMKITLEDYEKDLDEGGYIEMFSQSANQEPYERERPVARLYNSMNKNYQSIMKQLSDILPKQAQIQEDDGFDGFVNSR